MAVPMTQRQGGSAGQTRERGEEVLPTAPATLLPARGSEALSILSEIVLADVGNCLGSESTSQGSGPGEVVGMGFTSPLVQDYASPLAELLGDPVVAIWFSSPCPLKEAWGRGQSEGQWAAAHISKLDSASTASLA